MLCNSYGLQNVYKCYKIHQEQLILASFPGSLFRILSRSFEFFFGLRLSVPDFVWELG